MIEHIATVAVYVEDQQKSLDFWTEKVGFTAHRDDPMAPNARWIEVGPEGARSCLVIYPKPMRRSPSRPGLSWRRSRGWRTEATSSSRVEPWTPIYWAWNITLAGTWPAWPPRPLYPGRIGAEDAGSVVMYFPTRGDRTDADGTGPGGTPGMERPLTGPCRLISGPRGLGGARTTPPR